MRIVPLIIDSRPAYLEPAGALASLLLCDLGTQTLLEAAQGLLGKVTDEAATILTAFAADRDYERSVRTVSSLIEDVAPIESYGAILSGLEPSDWLLIFDPRRFPIDRTGFPELVRNSNQSRAARHLVAMETNPLGTREYVLLDGRGRVQRIQRYYDGVTWLQTRAVAASLVPVSGVRGFPSAALRDLTVLRETLVAAGAVSRDIRLPAGVFDLDREHGLVQLCECSILEQLDRAPPASYRVIAPDTWAGPDCYVDPSARFHGPVILREGAHIEPHVTLIGPMVIGAGSRVGEHSVLARCLVARGAVVARRTTSQHCVHCGENGHAHGDAGAQPPRALDYRLLKRLSVVLPTERMGGPQRRHRRETYVAIKRVIDGVVAVLGLAMSSPLLLLAALAIKLSSRGPVFFCHEREGKNGRVFRCCKLRTMVMDAHRQQRGLYRANSVDGPQFKLPEDPRVTWLGRWLRLSNIDELPQLLNVVCGHMSLIGPRPSPFRENQICVPWREARLAVRPGISGLWQICRHERSAGDFHQWIHYDMLYVRHLSPWLDLKILLVTLLTLGGRWSVPVTWLIPARRLREDREARVQERQPNFGLACKASNN